jgi:hypothetical protein
MKIETAAEALKQFELLGIKYAQTERQRKNGTIVYELPFKRCSAGGNTVSMKFALYESGYVRDVSGWNASPWQLNKKYGTREKIWSSYLKEYREYTSYKRVLIDNHEDRLVYLANYILKNYYRNPSKYMVGEWTRECMVKQRVEAAQCQEDLPFNDDVQVIVNGHRYNLS